MSYNVTFFTSLFGYPCDKGLGPLDSRLSELINEGSMTEVQTHVTLINSVNGRDETCDENKHRDDTKDEKCHQDRYIDFFDA